MACTVISREHNDRIKSYPQDNIIENYLEDAIEKDLGLPEGYIDLSPNTPEYI